MAFIAILPQSTYNTKLTKMVAEQTHGRYFRMSRLKTLPDCPFTLKRTNAIIQRISTVLSRRLPRKYSHLLEVMFPDILSRNMGMSLVITPQISIVPLEGLERNQTGSGIVAGIVRTLVHIQLSFTISV